MESLKHIQLLLNGFQKKIGAQMIMLLETTGQIIYASREDKTRDVLSLASLMIGVSVASQQLGTLIGEKNSPTLIQEGKQSHLLSLFIMDNVILVVLIDKTERLGFVRFKAKQYQAVLKALVERLQCERETVINPLANVTEEEVDRLLGF